jgi:hypothetical protein
MKKSFETAKKEMDKRTGLRKSDSKFKNQIIKLITNQGKHSSS